MECREGDTAQTRVLKIIPSSKRNTPRKQRDAVVHHPRVSKTIPNYKGRNNTADTGIKNNTQQQEENLSQTKSRTPTTGIENDTQHQEEHLSQTKSRSPPSQVSKTIPIYRGRNNTADTGIKNNTQQQEEHLSQTKSRSPSTGIENDTQHQEGHTVEYQKGHTTQPRVSKTIPNSREYKESRKFNDIRKNSFR